MTVREWYRVAIRAIQDFEPPIINARATWYGRNYSTAMPALLLPCFLFKVCELNGCVEKVSLVSWCLGLLVPWSFGLLVSWSLWSLGLLGLLVSWCLGLLVPWSFGLLVSWSLGLLVSWSLGLLVSWCLGVLVSAINYDSNQCFRLFLAMLQTTIR